ncbi:hypothetical protein HMPREF9162_1812 [Selenomonas sp. oral taxon 137 str. F0430]|nr:hypothetical protein HMPREF9162_1812 [Selenomonas sp. oral taxon 137 str. F0430]
MKQITGQQVAAQPVRFCCGNKGGYTVLFGSRFILRSSEK